MMQACAVSLAGLLLLLPIEADAGELQASDQATGDSFGYSVSVSGNTGLIGAYGKDNKQGAAYLFSNLDNSLGSEDAQFAASDPAVNNFFATSVSLSGSGALIGAEGNNSDRGAAYFFSDISTSTSVKLLASDGTHDDEFGAALSLSGTSALVGAFQQNTLQGAAYLFRDLDSACGTVNETARLVASDGGPINRFGISASLAGSIGLVGADLAHSFQGAAYLFRNLDAATGTINQNAILVASDATAASFFGNSVSVSGTNGLVGAYLQKVGLNAGQGEAYLFGNLDTVTGTVTETVKITAFDGAANDNFGHSVSLSGTTALIGADNKNSATGAAYLIPDVSNPSRK